MGAYDFITYSADVEVEEAFKTAVAEAACAHGGNGYSGTIAEKHEFTVIDAAPRPLAEAVALARELLADDDHRIDDKWGPAGAIAVSGGGRTVSAPIPVSPYGYADLEAAARAALAGLLGSSETVCSVGGAYSADAAGRVVSGSVSVKTIGADGHTGWLFVGWAPS